VLLYYREVRLAAGAWTYLADMWPWRSNRDLTPGWNADPSAIPDPPSSGRDEKRIAAGGKPEPAVDSPPRVSVPAWLKPGLL
jgi:hypothetical protein